MPMATMFDDVCRRVKSTDGEEEVCSVNLLKWLLDPTAVNLLGSKSDTCEDHRIRWTTYTNIKMWFDN